MKLEIPIQSLKPYFSMISGILPQKSPMPVLSGFKLVASEDQQIIIYATDLERSLIVHIPAKVEKPGETVIPAKLFMSWLSATEGESVRLALVTGNKLKASVGLSDAHFSCFAVEEYPLVRVMEGLNQTFAIPSDRLSKMIKGVAFSTNDEIKTSFKNGVFFNLKGKVLAVAGTDGFRVAEYVYEVESDIEGHALIPSASAILASRMDFGANQPMTIGFDGSRMGFSCGSMEVGSLQIDNTFPDYRQIIPKTSPIIYTFSQRALSSALARLSVMAADSRLYIDVTKEDDNVLANLVVVSPEIGGGEEELEVTSEPGKNSPIKVMVNLEFIKQAVAFCGETVIMAMRSPNRQIVITSPEISGWLAVMMPFTLNPKSEPEPAPAIASASEYA